MCSIIRKAVQFPVRVERTKPLTSAPEPPNNNLAEKRFLEKLMKKMDINDASEILASRAEAKHEAFIFHLRTYAIVQLWYIHGKAIAMDPSIDIDFGYDHWKVPAGVEIEKVRRLHLQYKVWHSIAINPTSEGICLPEADILTEFARICRAENGLVACLHPDDGMTEIWKPTRTKVLLSTPVEILVQLQAPGGRALVLG